MPCMNTTYGNPWTYNVSKDHCSEDWMQSCRHQMEGRGVCYNPDQIWEECHDEWWEDGSVKGWKYSQEMFHERPGFKFRPTFMLRKHSALVSNTPGLPTDAVRTRKLVKGVKMEILICRNHQQLILSKYVMTWANFDQQWFWRKMMKRDSIGVKTLYLICSMDTCFTRVNVAHIRMVVEFAPQAKRHASILVVRSPHWHSRSWRQIHTTKGKSKWMLWRYW